MVLSIIQKTFVFLTDERKIGPVNKDQGPVLHVKCLEELEFKTKNCTH